MPGAQMPKPPGSQKQNIQDSSTWKNQSASWSNNSVHPDFQQKVHVRQKQASLFSPGAVLGVLSFLLVFASIGTAVTHFHSSFGSNEYTSAENYETASSYYSIPGDISWMKSGDDYIGTFEIIKDDPDTLVSSTSGIMHYYDADGEEQISYFSVPEMDYFTDRVWVNADAWMPDGQTLDGAWISFEDPVYTQDISNESWVTDEIAPDNAAIRKALKNDPSYARRKIEVVDDGVKEQDGFVMAKITQPADASSYGEVNVIFKKDGKVVFADTSDYSYNGSDEGGTFSFAYTAPYKLPAYDEVVIEDLG